MTVEIGYALLSATFAAGLALGAVSGPALLFHLPLPVEKVLITAGYCWPPRSSRYAWSRCSSASAARLKTHPSHPGRTNPDS